MARLLSWVVLLVGIFEPEEPDSTERVRQLLLEKNYAAAEDEARGLVSRAGASSPEAAQALDLLVEALLRGGKAAELEWKDFAGRSVRIREAILGQESAALADSLHRLGYLLYGAGAAQEAVPRLERALRIREKALPPGDAKIADTCNNLASALVKLGDYTRAEDHYRRALEIRDQLPDRRNLESTLTNLAGLLWLKGDYTAARPLLERALEIPRRSGDDARIAKTLNVLGLILHSLGDLEEARERFDEALRILERTVGPRDPEAAAVLGNLGLLLDEQEDLPGARSCFERALAIWKEAPGSQEAQQATYLNNLGWVHHRSGDLAAAKTCYQEALALRRRALGPDHPDVAWTLNNLGLLLHENGELAGAQPNYEEALGIREKALGPDHPLVAQSLNDLARLRLDAGDPAQALPLALRGEEVGRAHVRSTAQGLPEREALRYASARTSVARRTTGWDLLVSLARSGLPPEGTRNVLDALVRSRALVLDEMVSRRRALCDLGDPLAARSAAELLSARERLANLRVRGPAGEDPTRHRSLLDDARSQAEALERELAARSAAFRRAGARGRIGLADVASSLPAGSALVSFVRHESPAGRGREAPAYTAFVLVEGGEPTAVPLAAAAAIDRLASRWHAEASRGALKAEGSAAEVEGRCREAGEALRRAVWDPLAARIAGAGRVFIVPDGALHFISFAALPAGPSSFLLEGGAIIHYLSAERDVAGLDGPPRPGDGLLALGGAAFGEGVTAPAAAGANAEGEEVDFSSHVFAPLPASLREAEAVARLWEEPAREGRRDRGAAVLLTGAEAIEATFQRLAPGRSVLHLATHGFFLGGEGAQGPARLRGIGRVVPARRPEGAEARPLKRPPPPDGGSPALSGLALAGANRRAEAATGTADGILTAEEIGALDLSSVEWAVLSACETGAGVAQAGEGVLGLRRAFQVAGAKTLIISLWAVEDEAAREWMLALYRCRLRRGLGTAEAVRDASLEILRRRRASGAGTHPFYWAGFVAAGEWR